MPAPTVEYIVAVKTALQGSTDEMVPEMYQDEMAVGILATSCWNNNFPFSKERFEETTPFNEGEITTVKEYAVKMNEALYGEGDPASPAPTFPALLWST